MSPPKLSVVMPSFNQAAFLEEAMQSVLGQKYPELEFVVMDGGSTDGSVEMIRQRESELAFWTSAPDGGHYAAINAGFARTSGEVMAWLNSDDKYFPWTFSIVAEIFAQFPEIEWLTTLFPIRWDERGRAMKCTRRPGYTREGFRRSENLPGGDWYSTGWIQQESTFWRRSLWERAGGRLDASLSLAGDFDLWARFHQHATLYAAATPLGGFRLHGDQRSFHQRATYLEQASAVLQKTGGKPPNALHSALRYRGFKHLPEPLALALGLSYPAKIVTPRRDNSAWIIETVAA